MGYRYNNFLIIIATNLHAIHTTDNTQDIRKHTMFFSRNPNASIPAYTFCLTVGEGALLCTG